MAQIHSVREPWIHGDVIKKFDYYSLCYLQKDTCPTTIISHGVLLDENKHKLRWQNINDDNSVIIDGIDNHILRAYFLNFNNGKDRIFSLKNIQQESAALVKLFVKIGRILETRNLDQDQLGVSEELQRMLQQFRKDVDNFRFKGAFDVMNNYVNWCWKFVKNEKISTEEQNTLADLRKIFFGQ